MTQRPARGPDERARLRRDLLDLRWPVDQIAEQLQRRFGDSPLAAFRHAAGLSQAEVATRWDTICAPRGEATMTGTRISAYERYPAPGTKRPTAGVLAVFAEIYATTPRRLISPTLYAQLPAQERLLIDRIEHAQQHAELIIQDTGRQQLTTAVQQHWVPGRSYPTAPGGDELLNTDPHLRMSERALIMAAAHESSEHAGWAETTNVGEATLEQLDADVFRIANDYVHVPPLPMVIEMLRVRRRVYRLLQGHQKPTDTTQLYLLAGILCGLLANASTDLGYHPAAAEQARAAWAYAEITGHNGLRAWTRGMQALIEYWSHRPRQAARLAQGAQRFADSTTAKVRLFTIEARMWARLGNLEQTHRCIRAATQARETTTTDTLHDEIGGVFGFTHAKNHYYAGATYIHLGQADLALNATRQAIDLYTNGPTDQRSYGAESLARIDSAMAHLLKGSLEGAIDALQPVLALPVDKRIAQLNERLTGLRHRIAYPAFRDAQEAHDLDERIEEFCTTPAAQDIPPTNFTG
jgi:hypothetical protein